MSRYRRFEEIELKNRLEIVENVLDDYEKKIDRNDGLTENEVIEYNKLVSEHKEIIDRLGYSTFKYKGEDIE